MPFKLHSSPTPTISTTTTTVVVVAGAGQGAQGLWLFKSINTSAAAKNSNIYTWFSFVFIFLFYESRRILPAENHRFEALKGSTKLMKNWKNKQTGPAFGHAWPSTTILRGNEIKQLCYSSHFSKKNIYSCGGCPATSHTLPSHTDLSPFSFPAVKP